MKAILTLAVLVTVLPLCAADSKQPSSAGKKSLPERVNEFVAKYDTEQKITERLAAWTKEEPNSPEPYILAANAYLKTSSQVQINSGANAPGFASIVDPKTKKAVGAISEGPSAKGYQLALAALTTATAKFPQRLDIPVGRLSIARSAGDVDGMVAAGQDLVKAAQTEGEKARWIDDAPLPMPLPDKVVAELQGRIAWLYQREKDETDEAAHTLALEGLKVAPDSVQLLNSAAVYHLYKQEWATAKPYLERAEKSDPKDLIAKHNLARVLTELGDKKAARAKLQEIIKLSPNSDDAKDAQQKLKELDKGKKAE